MAERVFISNVSWLELTNKLNDNLDSTASDFYRYILDKDEDPD